jgi:hypothetical protein
MAHLAPFWLDCASCGFPTHTLAGGRFAFSSRVFVQYIADPPSRIPTALTTAIRPVRTGYPRFALQPVFQPDFDFSCNPDP